MMKFWKPIIADLLPVPDRQATGIAVADIDFSVINSVRSRMPISEVRTNIDSTTYA